MNHDVAIDIQLHAGVRRSVAIIKSGRVKAFQLANLYSYLFLEYSALLCGFSEDDQW